MTAPDRIWAWPFIVSKQDDIMKGGWNDEPDRREDEYLLSNPERELAGELVEALAQCRDEIDGYIRQEYPGDNPVHERCRQRDFAANPARAILAKLDEKGEDDE